jgi:ssDNA-binding Zn-finger/Zn-ribbon topoisomerase 1
MEALTYYTNEQLAEYFASLNVKADRLRFLGDVLEDIGELMKKQEAESEARTCAECGGSLAHLDGRARHCSPKCRQAAYRKRVTVRASDRTEKASQRRLRDGATVAENGLAVTQSFRDRITDDDLPARRAAS